VLGQSFADIGDQPPGLEIRDATYGGNVLDATAIGNVTGDVASHCSGADACDYAVDYQVIGDPAPGSSKDFVVHYVCDGADSVFTATVAAEAGVGGRATLACPWRQPSITVVAATFGGNLGLPRGNATGPVATVCDGSFACDYFVDVGVIGDPAVGSGKDFSVEYTCAQGGVSKVQMLPPGSGFNTPVRLHCP